MEGNNSGRLCYRKQRRRHRADWSGIAGVGIEAATSTTLGRMGKVRDSQALQFGCRGVDFWITYSQRWSQSQKIQEIRPTNNEGRCRHLFSWQSRHITQKHPKLYTHVTHQCSYREEALHTLTGTLLSDVALLQLQDALMEPFPGPCSNPYLLLKTPTVTSSNVRPSTGRAGQVVGLILCLYQGAR